MILNGLPWKWTEIILSFLRLHPSTAFQTLVDYDGYSISSEGFLPAVVDIMIIWVKIRPFQSILVHWLLECQRSPLPSPVWLLPICLDSWTWHSRPKGRKSLKFSQAERTSRLSPSIEVKGCFRLALKSEMVEKLAAYKHSAEFWEKNLIELIL